MPFPSSWFIYNYITVINHRNHVCLCFFQLFYSLDLFVSDTSLITLYLPSISLICASSHPCFNRETSFPLCPCPRTGQTGAHTRFLPFCSDSVSLPVSSASPSLPLFVILLCRTSAVVFIQQRRRFEGKSSFSTSVSLPQKRSDDESCCQIAANHRRYHYTSKPQKFHPGISLCFLYLLIFSSSRRTSLCSRRYLLTDHHMRRNGSQYRNSAAAKNLKFLTNLHAFNFNKRESLSDMTLSFAISASFSPYRIPHRYTSLRRFSRRWESGPCRIRRFEQSQRRFRRRRPLLRRTFFPI